jgi:beta-glucanase (GH16 family)
MTIKDGKLSILTENVGNHGLQYRSGMLQSWNKFCFSGGYIGVGMTQPGLNTETGICEFGFFLFLAGDFLFCLVAWCLNYGKPW